MGLPGRGKGVTGEDETADVVNDGQWIAVAVIAEQKLALVIGGHQIVRCGSHGPSTQRMSGRVAPRTLADQIGATQNVADGGRRWPVDARMELGQSNSDLARSHVGEPLSERDHLRGDLVVGTMRNVDRCAGTIMESLGTIDIVP